MYWWEMSEYDEGYADGYDKGYRDACMECYDDYDWGYDTGFLQGNFYAYNDLKRTFKSKDKDSFTVDEILKIIEERKYI